MLVHGAWLSPSFWDRFKQRFEAAGVTVTAPPWPFCGRPAAMLRRAPDPRLGRLGLRAIVDHHAGLVEALPHPPILMGHGFGGLIVQLLLDRGLGAAGVAIASAPPYGLPPGVATLRSAVATLRPWSGWHRISRMPQQRFSARLAQTLPAAERPYAYDKFVVPAPGGIFLEALLGIGTRLRWDNPLRAPLLLIGGDMDRTVPAALVERTYRRHLRSPARTEHHVFPGRSHWLCNEDGWEEVADHALRWGRQNAGRMLR